MNKYMSTRTMWEETGRRPKEQRTLDGPRRYVRKQIVTMPLSVRFGSCHSAVIDHILSWVLPLPHQTGASLSPLMSHQQHPSGLNVGCIQRDLSSSLLPMSQGLSPSTCGMLRSCVDQGPSV